MASLIPNEGAIEFLRLLLNDYSSATFCLFTNDVVIGASTELSDLTEAAWSGYAPHYLNTFTVPTIVAGKAESTANANPSFTNGSGSPQSFYGWFIKDPTGTKILAAENIGETTIPAGEGYLFYLVATLRQDPG